MRTRLLLLLTSVIAIGALVGGATFALFTATASSTGNQFTAGTLSISNTDLTTWSVNFDDMAPGDTVTKQVEIKNTGSLPLYYAPLLPTRSGALFGGATPARYDIQLTDNQLNPNETATVTLSVSLPLTAGNTYQGATGTMSITFQAFQSENLIHLTEADGISFVLLSQAHPTWDKYELRNGTTQIPLFENNIVSFMEHRDGLLTPTFISFPVEGNTDPYYWLAGSRPTGTYVYDIVTNDGKWYTVSINHTHR